MFNEQEPNLITSAKSGKIVVDGYPFQIEIFRMETEDLWTLEVVDHHNTSHVWDDQFVSDTDARDLAVKTISTEGATAFIHGNNVVPFPKI
ncbi:hypothetical protein SAMN03159496_05554 [Rhizobium sp. NFR07]|nr:hypothetical protein SAMN03159496_05554 [Rhizobium sp. NFR07]